MAHTERYPLKRYDVMLRLPDNSVEHETVIANFAFNNGPEGVVFRRYESPNTLRTTVVALYPDETMVRYHGTIIDEGTYFYGN